MIRYSERARKAFAFLFRPFNDIDIYVEDVASRNSYEILFSRMLNGRCQINRIFQVGDRRKVIEQCRNDQGSSGRPKLYIVDGDLELLLGKAPPRLKHIYRLNVYTSENLLLCETALVEVAYDAIANLDKPKVRQLLDYHAFMNTVLTTLIPLFETYACAHKLDPTIKTVGTAVERYASDRLTDGFLSAKKIADRINDILIELGKKNDAKQIASTRREVNRMINRLRPEHLISGKTYLLPLVHRLLRERAHYRGNREQLKCQLARFGDTDVDPGLRRALLRAARIA